MNRVVYATIYEQSPGGQPQAAHYEIRIGTDLLECGNRDTLAEALDRAGKALGEQSRAMGLKDVVAAHRGGHPFAGRHDRACVICCRPDRDPIHFTTCPVCGGDGKPCAICADTGRLPLGPSDSRSEGA